MYPIKTFINNNVVVKICTEDIHKLVDLIHDTAEDVHDNIQDIVSEYDYPFEPTITSTGKAKLQDGDEYNEEIGKEIAFKKVKLYANIKKLHILERVLNEYKKGMDILMERAFKYDYYIRKDIDALRQYNPNYNVNY